jgi:hypothetical protein
VVARLTDKEIEILQLKHKGLKNKQIAEMREVSEADISQTLSRITKKINSIQDVIGVLQNIGVLESDMEIELTQSGRTFLNQLSETRLEELHPIQKRLPMKRLIQPLSLSSEFNIPKKSEKFDRHFRDVHELSEQIEFAQDFSHLEYNPFYPKAEPKTCSENSTPYVR